ncbi:Zinc finger CCHC-type protein [Dioscorea alata]|uniref:Zinc finger CCHC-type protein n=1 Tax=Dioscorea alata TaxID=55571 RepID=A0ACB7UFZ5_DIOAL|nr:Zinc finger CCHC-type protein [Dioscorea alata]
MSLLGDLWVGATKEGGGVAGSGKVSEGVKLGGEPLRKGMSAEVQEGKLRRQDVSYAQAVSSSSSGVSRSLRLDIVRSPKEKASNLPRSSVQLASSKRPRSPRDATCGRCFRNTHKTSECRHQVVCLRCDGVGHVAARCAAVLRRSPRKPRVHVRTKRELPHAVGLAKDGASVQVSDGQNQRVPAINHVSLSLSLSPEISTVREELAKVVIVSVELGFVNESSVVEVIPSIINQPLAGPLTPINEFTFLAPLPSRADVKEICKMGTCAAMTKDGQCSLKFAPWSVELGADGRASGAGQWVLIWNLPLHGWCWSVIEAVLKPIGELISISQASTPHKKFISVLARQRQGVLLPLELDLSLGMRRYKILMTADKDDFPTFHRGWGRYVLPASKDTGERLLSSSLSAPPQRSTHEIAREAKGKEVEVAPMEDSRLDDVSLQVSHLRSDTVDGALPTKPRAPLEMVKPRFHQSLDPAKIVVEPCSQIRETQASVVERRSHGGAIIQHPHQTARVLPGGRLRYEGWTKEQRSGGGPRLGGSRHGAVERWLVRAPGDRDKASGAGAPSLAFDASEGDVVQLEGAKSSEPLPFMDPILGDDGLLGGSRLGDADGPGSWV